MSGLAVGADDAVPALLVEDSLDSDGDGGVVGGGAADLGERLVRSWWLATVIANGI